MAVAVQGRGPAFGPAQGQAIAKACKTISGSAVTPKPESFQKTILNTCKHCSGFFGPTSVSSTILAFFSSCLRGSRADPPIGRSSLQRASLIPSLSLNVHYPQNGLKGPADDVADDVRQHVAAPEHDNGPKEPTAPDSAMSQQRNVHNTSKARYIKQCCPRQRSKKSIGGSRT